MMRLDIITLFPAMFTGPFDESIVGRARRQGLIEINLINLRDFTHDKHRTVDDSPYGGGAGMVLKCEPLFEAVESLRTPTSQVILLCPQGQTLRQPVARELATESHLILICAHYEGVDERVRLALVDRVISIGDYILTNGNLAAMILVDAVVRLLPGVLGSDDSSVEESFSQNLLEYPHFTRPETFRGMQVPEILLSGNHQAIARWRHDQSLERTRERRPDLLTPTFNNDPTDGDPSDEQA